MPNLNCELLKVNGLSGVAVVTLHGSIDPRSVEPLAGALEAAKAKGCKVSGDSFDLCGVTFRLAA